MPTRNRRAFVGQAVLYFLRQGYPRTELVVVDDGEPSVADLLPADSRIRYVRLERPRSDAALDEVVESVARGDIIAHWSDDDWMAPRRLQAQVDAFLASGADACAVGNVFHLRLDAGRAWRRRGAVTATSIHRRGTRAHAARTRVLDDPSLYVVVLHHGTMRPPHTGGDGWEERPVAEVGDLLGHDRPFYAALRARRELPPPRPAPACGAVTVASHFMIFDGYGSMAELLVRGLAREGTQVNVVPLRLEPHGLSAEFVELLRASRPTPGAPMLYFNPIDANHPQLRTDDLIINTMWESDVLPRGWSAEMNRARAVIAPTRWFAQVCRQNGVRVPIEVVPEGVDPEIYHFVDRPEREGPTVLMVGTHVPRKHVREGVLAFVRGLPIDKYPHARLLIKARFRVRPFTCDDPRVTFVDAAEPTRGIMHWYARADVLMALGNEGFGLPLVEGMATGLPVIALATEGQADACTDARECVLPVGASGREVHELAPYGQCGMRAVPDVDQTAARLRWVADHAADARALGRRASAWATEHRNIWDKPRAVLDVMERAVVPSRPLRRRHTIWAMSAADITMARSLASRLGAAAVVDAPPTDYRGVRTLILLHDGSTAGDTTLFDALAAARAAGVATIVVVENAATASTLRTLWPTVRVVPRSVATDVQRIAEALRTFCHSLDHARNGD